MKQLIPTARVRRCSACGRSIRERRAIQIHGRRFHRACAVYSPRAGGSVA